MALCNGLSGSEATEYSAVMKDIEKMKQLVYLMNVGDPIKFSFAPGQNNEGFDTLNIPEKFSVEYQR